MPRRDGDRHVHGHDVDRLLGGLVTPVFALFGYDVDARLADLAVWRIITGLGIGGMLAAINAVVAEFSNTKRRDLNVAIMSIGYPVGAALGGFITSTGLELAEWRSVFYFGATVTVVMIPTVYFLMPESVHWLARKQPEGALDRINRTLTKLGHQTIAELPSVSADVRKRSSGDLFRPPLLTVTILATMAYFFHITTFYYIVKWVPTIVVGMGFAPSSAGYVLSWLNVGGATGGTVLGLLSQRFSVKALTITVMLLSTIAVTLFGRSPADLTKLILICMVAGSAPTPPSPGCTRSSPRPFRRMFGPRGRASQSASDAAGRCWRRSLPATCSRPSRCRPSR